MTRRAAYLLTLRIARWFVAGLIVTIAIAWASTRWTPTPRAQTLASARRTDELLSVTIDESPISRSILISHVFGEPWASARAVGLPDTQRMGDIPTAWASLTPDGQVEWLELTFDPAIAAKAVRIYETNAPGALTSISSVDSSGRTKQLWFGNDPAAPDSNGIYVAKVPIAPDEPISAVRLHLNSPKVSGWNEIDAVALIDRHGDPHWAVKAAASSTYAAAYVTPPSTSIETIRRIVPRWIPIEWNDQTSPGQTIRRFEGRGWPFIALWGEAPPNAAVIDPLRLHRPAWIGLPADSALFGLALFLLYQCTFGLRRFLREATRARRGCCIQCGYDLRFDLAAGCPECGWRRE